MSDRPFHEAVNAIVNDIEDRRGLGDEWGMIDDDVQAEIRDAWARLIKEACGG